MCTKSYNHMRYGSGDKAETGRMRQAEFFVILGFFLPSPPVPNNLEKQNFEKMKKTAWTYYPLHLCSINEGHVINDSWNIRHDRQNFLSFWTIVCPFTTLTIHKIKILKNWKKKLGDIIILHICTINYNHMMYDIWDIKCSGQNV